MARRRRGRTGAFSDMRLAALSYAIQSLFERRVASIRTCALTHDEYLQLFVRPEHRRLLKEVQETVDLAHMDRSFSIDKFALSMPEIKMPSQVRLQVGLHEENGLTAPAVPLYTKSGYVSDSAPELLQRVTDWLRERVLIGYDFGLADSVLNYLNHNCSNARQVRYFWPSLLALCSQREDLEGLANELREPGQPQNLPTLPISVRDACRRTAAAISTALILPSAEEQLQGRVRSGVEVELFGSYACGPTSDLYVSIK